MRWRCVDSSELAGTCRSTHRLSSCLQTMGPSSRLWAVEQALDFARSDYQLRGARIDDCPSVNDNWAVPTLSPTDIFQPVSEKMTADIARKLRFLGTQLRVYPETHSMVQDAARGLCAVFLETTGSGSKLRLDFLAGVFRANGTRIPNGNTEYQHSGTLAQWFRERGVESLALDSGLREDEILRAMGWLSRGAPALLKQTLAQRPPEDLRLESLVLNPAGTALDGGELETTDLGLKDDAAPPPVDAPATSPAPPGPSPAAAGAAQAMADGAALFEATPRTLPVGEPTPQSVPAQPKPASTAPRIEMDWLKADPRAFDAIAERIARGGKSGLPVPPAHIARDAWNALRSAPPNNLGSYLATDLPASNAGQALRLTVLAGIKAEPSQAAPVLRQLVQLITGEAEEEAVSTAAVLRALEELTLPALRAGALEDVVESTDLAHRLSFSSTSAEVRDRAATALSYVATPELLRALLETLELAGPRNQELVFELLRLLGRFAVGDLIAELSQSTRRRVRLTIVEILTHIGKSAVAEGKDPADWLRPVVEELDLFERKPWYVTRNLVSILSRVESDTFYRFLLRLMESDADPRVLCEAVRGLIAADTNTARELVRKGVFGGQIKDPTALYEAMPYLHRVGPAATVAGLKGLLSHPELSQPAVGAALLGLAEGGGAKVIPVLEAIVKERTAVLRRATYDERVRIAAVRALATIDVPAAQTAVSKFTQDASAALRRVANEFCSLEADPARAQVRRQLGIRLPPSDEGA